MSNLKSDPSSNPNDSDSSDGEGKLSLIWESISQWGLAEAVIHYSNHILTFITIIIAVYIMRSFYSSVEEDHQADIALTAQVIAAPTLEAAAEELGSFGGPFSANLQSVFPLPEQLLAQGIPRFTQPQTTIPTRARVVVTTYEVEQGDNLFSIADNFGLRPESILWGNPYGLQGDFRYISPGLTLNILPVDGVYHQWSEGESIQAVARFYEVDVNSILEWPGNHLDSYEVDAESLELFDGTWIIVPGGKKEIVDWGPPAITRDNPAVAAYYGAGSCGAVYEGAIGNGTFIWPTASSQISGYYYDPVLHPGIDIGGPAGNAVFAVDAGVVVYAGFSDYGYGNMVVIDHGTGWQTAYAHLLSYNVSCGQSVYQGDVIAAVGNSGNSSGAHLHFEMTSVLYGKVNPFDWMSP